MDLQPWLDTARAWLDQFGALLLLRVTSLPTWSIPLIAGLFVGLWLASLILARRRLRRVLGRLEDVERTLAHVSAEQEQQRLRRSGETWKSRSTLLS